MNFIKQNIWSLFYTLAFISILVSSILAYILWHNTYSEQQREQESLALLSSNAISSILSQYEAILEILGVNLLEHGHYKNTQKSKEKLKRILKLNPSIAGLGLVGLDGNLMLTSINKDVKKLPNLWNKKESIHSFHKAINSEIMVLGRTYYHNTLKTYIVPIRKSIKDNVGKTLAVMTGGIKTQNTFHLKAGNQNKSFEYSVNVIRDSDYYRQLVSDGKDLKSLYNEPVPLEFINYVMNKTTKKYSLSIEDMKRNEKVFTIIYTKPTSKHEAISSIRFIKKYQLWLVVETSYDELKNKFYYRLIPLVSFFFLLIAILWVLFKQIYSSEEKKKRALRFQAEHDYLTKLKNRFYLSKQFSVLNEAEPFALIMINIDNFKNVNENFGPKIGDLVLKDISLRLKSFQDINDALIRNSGDEFFFIKRNTNTEYLKKLAQEIINKLSGKYGVNNYTCIVSVSIGISQFPKDGKSFEDIKKYADIAMHEAKKEKKIYYLFEDTIKEKYLRRSLIEQELKMALTNNEIYMMYQPQINKDGSLHGVEALVRWENSKLGFVPPDEFIKIAESSEIMCDIGDFVINTSLREMKQLQEKINQSFQLSINISIKQFSQIGFYKKLFDSIDKREFNKLLITLEVTESLFINDIESILKILNSIKKRKLQISLDDFGTGYSSLSLLKKLPIDELKIDKSFIDDITTDENAKNMVQSIILLGKQLKMVVLAEGIEQEEQKNLLDLFGCDIYQGYYFAKPLKKDDLQQYIINL